MNLLLIESDRNSTGWLAERLPEWGFVPRRASSTQHALSSGLASQAVAMIIDMGPAGLPGCELIRPLRAAGHNQPLMLLSPHGGWRDKVDCLDAGADDYLIKPVRAEEVAARLRVILRRCAGSAEDCVRAGALELNLKARTASVGGQPLDLTRNEYRLLRILMLQANQIIPPEQIREQLYPGMAARSLNAVEVHVARLRRKVGEDHIRTVRGVGYMLDCGEGATVTG